MNLVTLEYFLTNKTQNMDLNALFSEKIGTIFFAMTRYTAQLTLLFLLHLKTYNMIYYGYFIAE